MQVRDVMTHAVVSVQPGTQLRDVARLLAAHRISGVPIIDEGGTCVGVVSEGDLLIKHASHAQASRQALDWIFGERHDPDETRRRAATIAEEAMTSPPIVIEPDRPIREAATLMVDHGVNRLPVIDNGRLVGIVSRADLVRAYLRLDEEIVRLVREDVLRRTMWLDPADFEVTAKEGIVRIQGSVDRRSTARIVARLIGVVEGVVRVESDLRWEVDDTRLKPAGETEHEPGSASMSARERPQPLHR